MRQKIKNEFLKLKHSKLLYFILGVILFSPIALLMMAIILNSNPKYDQVTYVEYMAMILKFIISFVSILLYPWIASEIIAREFRMDTIKSQLTIPISRTDFLITKLTMVSIIIIFMTLLNCFLGLIVSYINNIPGITLNATIKFLLIYLKTAILILPFSYVTILMVLYFKRTLIPMVINVLLVLATFLISGSDYQAIFPWTIPFRIVFITIEQSPLYTMGESYFALTLLAVVSVYLADRRINRMEI